MFFGYHRLEEVNKPQPPNIEIVVKETSKTSDSSNDKFKKSLEISSSSDEEDKYLRLPGGRIFARRIKKGDAFMLHLDRWRLPPKEQT